MSQPNPKTRAVLFDADGVIQRTKPGWLDELGSLCGKSDEVDDFIADVFAAEQPCLVGERDFVELLASVLEKWRSPSTVQDALSVWTLIDPDRDVLALIRSIRANGTIVALATNQQEHRANYMLNNLGYSAEFDHILCSCYLKLAKPADDYFQKSLEKVGFLAEEVLFIDDHQSNIDSAKRAGMQAQRFHLDDGLQTLVNILQSYGLLAR
jgi:putative hydrolase of the HAD superfamily